MALMRGWQGALSGRAGPPLVCPSFPVGSRRFPTWCWIRADPWVGPAADKGPIAVTAGNQRADATARTYPSRRAQRHPIAVVPEMLQSPMIGMGNYVIPPSELGNYMSADSLPERRLGPVGGQED